MTVEAQPEAVVDEAAEPAHEAGEGEPHEDAEDADGFAPLGLSEPILRALHDKGYLRPTPIQAQAIPTVLMGRDVLGCAQTGTGKTAGFTLPLLDILSGSRARARMPRSLILEPTRELALQVAENFVAYGKYLKLNHALLIGGESMNDQKDALTKGVDVLIATPGRLIDLFERGGLMLNDVRVLVIDEADRMLDMGFIPDIERIVGLLPKTRQTLFFSATMAPEIRRLADAFLDNPKEITVSKPASVATTITSGLVLVQTFDKREALRRLIKSEDVQNALIFCNRKRDVDILLKSLVKHGFDAGALHGDLAQSVRFATLEKFKANEIRLLVCSDVAARGIDIGGLSHVFNFDVPHHAEDYVHRIGRTGRAGREGRAFTIATPDDKLAVEAVEKLISAPIPRIEIPGLDSAEWSEDDGRRGRGRGRGKPVSKPAAKSSAKPRGEEPRRERNARPPRVEARGETRAEPVRVEQPVVEAPKREEYRRRETRFAERGERPERHERSERHERFERGHDHGPSVRGFGNDVPAFMLIRKRGALSKLAEAELHDESDHDASPEDNGNAVIAA
ncbi:MAG: DEAD/DEAH box helicase [Acidocella sp.]|nr:DEAD/DEAH box helicase [Acidocella sp.]